MSFVRWLSPLALVVVSACNGLLISPLPRLQATWYFVSANTPLGETLETRRREIYLGLLNEGPAHITKESKIYLNMTKDEVSNKRIPFTQLYRDLSIGELRYWRIASYSIETSEGTTHLQYDDATILLPCRLPVSVIIEESLSNRIIEAQIVATMPTSIPEGWNSTCASRHSQSIFPDMATPDTMTPISK